VSHQIIMKFAAVVAALFGLSLLFAPNALLEMYKAEQMNGPGIYNSMLYGGFLLAFGVMNWTASLEPAIRGARHVILGTFVAMTLGLFVAVIRQMTDSTIPPAAWLNVGIFLVFTVLFGYLHFARVNAVER
jgi:hypothetical protein